MVNEWHIFYTIIYMIYESRKFNTSVQDFLDMQPLELESFCRAILQDHQFRFITFEKNDFRNGKLTCIIYNYVPDSVFFSAESPVDVEEVMEELIVLNPGVQWSWANLNYFDQDDKGHSKLTVELKLSVIPMRVNANGDLIFK